MAGPLLLFRPFAYHAMRNALVVQTGTIERTVAIAHALRKLFPECRVDGVIRDDDAAEVGPNDFEQLTVVRWEDRIRMVRALRARRYDAVAVLLGGQSSRAYRLLPYLVRTKHILLFNERLDYFPLKWMRIRSLAQHVTGHGSIAALLRWVFGRVVLVPLAGLLLMASTLRIQLRAMRRRRLRTH